MKKIATGPIVQKQGPFGNINLTGIPGRPSATLPCNHPDFYINVERGIISIVNAAVASGFDTFSSCEGHIYPNGSAHNRHIGLIIENKDASRWSRAVQAINTTHTVNLELHFTSGSAFNPIFTRKYQNPTALNLCLGDPNDKNLSRKTALAIKLLKIMGALLRSKK